MIEKQIKELIITKYGSVRNFAFKIGLPQSTVVSILKRGFDNSNVNNVIKMCKALGISIDKALESNELILNIDNAAIPEYEINEEYQNEIDHVLFSKAKLLSDEEKQTIISVMDAIHKDIDKELDK